MSVVRALYFPDSLLVVNPETFRSPYFFGFDSPFPDALLDAWPGYCG
jgi:hypothetical protein